MDPYECAGVSPEDVDWDFHNETVYEDSDSCGGEEDSPVRYEGRFGINHSRKLLSEQRQSGPTS